jgi:leucyl aminopeptidase (aminopeptidase T)
LSNALYQFLSTKRRINITSESGGLGVKTNLIIETDARRFPWIPSGPVQPGEMANLPDGEVFCYPLNVNGTAVIDGCVGDYMAKKYGSIAKTPLVISFSNNEIRNVSCPGNPELEKDFRNYVFNLDGRREFLTRFVGELAFGTNTGVEALIGNMLQDEKCWKAIHIAAADPLDHDGSGAGYTCKGHIDCLMMSPTAVVDGITLMKDGNYSREILLDALKHLPDKYSLERSSGGIYTLKAA